VRAPCCESFDLTAKPGPNTCVEWPHTPDPRDFEDSDWVPSDGHAYGGAQPSPFEDGKPYDPATNWDTRCAPLAPVLGQAYAGTLLRRAFTTWSYDANGIFNHDDKLLLYKRVSAIKRYLLLAAKLTNKIKTHNCAKAPTAVGERLGMQYELNIARIFYFAAWCAFASKGGGLLTIPKPRKANRCKKKR
jgi:hypothetical protein